ncbi:MAG TPA: ATPase, T2SS/T4P/T4SS family [Burkholderiaceae bacterium]|nr:ATPase, T2SS/T4P/T4SS family [Burkholderiaceae bacterium]
MFNFRGKPNRHNFVPDGTAGQVAEIAPAAPAPMAQKPAWRSRVATPEPMEVIQDFSSLPTGSMVQGLVLSAEQRAQMVAIQVSSGEAIILVVPEAFGTAPALDLRHRLAKLDYPRAKMLQATADCIAFVQNKEHATELAAKEVKTEPEKLISELLCAAIALKASDIHVETRGPMADVFFRVNGGRQVIRNLTYQTAEDLAQVLHLKGEEGSKKEQWHRKDLSDAGITWMLPDHHEVSVRFSSLPIHPDPNFSFVLRIASMRSTSVRRIAEAGYTPEQLAMNDNMLGSNTGMIVYSGPTNSGKSASLAACLVRLYEMRGDSIKVMTAESPIENIVPSACQVPVGGSLEYATVLKGMLRQDADVVVPGEIRDAESASLVRDAVLSGRKVLTTLHTYSALGAWLRLRELGVSWDLLTMPGFISGVVYQRLVPTLCPLCKIPLGKGMGRLPKATLDRLQQVSPLEGANIHVRGDGCPACAMSGIAGRTLVAEFIAPDRQFLHHLERREIAAAEKYWQSTKLLQIDDLGVTALAHAISKIHSGILDPRSVEENVSLLNAEHTMASAANNRLVVPDGAKDDRILWKTGT